MDELIVVMGLLAQRLISGTNHQSSTATPTIIAIA